MFSDRPSNFQSTLIGWLSRQRRLFDETQPTRRNGDDFDTTLPPKIAPKTTRTHNSRKSLQIQVLKSEMLKSIEGLEGSPRPPVWHKITTADDRERLWDLRVDLMDVLAKARGEQVAMQLMVSITSKFSAVS